MSLKDAYQQKMAARIEELEAELSLARAKAKSLAADARIAAYEELAQTEQRLDALKTKAGGLKTAGEEAFKDMQGGLDKAWTELRGAATNAMKRFQ